MLQIFPCLIDDSFKSCNRGRTECVICPDDLVGEAKVCNKCVGRIDCFGESQKYRQPTGEITEIGSILKCEAFKGKVIAYINFIIRNWRDIPDKEHSVSFVKTGGYKKSKEFFNESDLDLIADKQYLEYQLFQRLSDFDRRIAISYIRGMKFYKICRWTKMSKSQVNRRYRRILNDLAVVKNTGRLNENPIKT